MIDVVMEIAGQSFRVDQASKTVLSIPVRFPGPQPNLYGVAQATSVAFETADMVGDTRRGGSCNFETITITPHCNGTHTECVGHISRDRIYLSDILSDALIPARLVTIVPVCATETDETTLPVPEDSDLLITARALSAACSVTIPGLLPGVADEFTSALIIRTLPNTEDKLSANYPDTTCAFLTVEAATWLKNTGVDHVLLDLPSVDRMYDEGHMAAHHAFWGVGAENDNVLPESCSHRTITELIYVPDTVVDGCYLLNLQVAPFVSDAAPSRPVLFPVQML